MFKKPLSNLKNSSPLRSSDRRKLRQRILTSFSLPTEDGDLLVPDGILTAKFSTHLAVPGIAYISPSGDPLWISVGKGSDELIPTVYTLWKKPTMLPFICTPSAVIPILIGGADLMIPGVMFSSDTLSEGQIVAICQYEKKDGGLPMISIPLAIGRMAVPSDKLKDEDAKGKAALTIHTWKDHLWDMGSKGDPPPPTPISSMDGDASSETSPHEDVIGSGAQPEVVPPPPATPASYTKEELSTLLRLSLLQAISKTFRELPSSCFPITLSTFYSSYILPCRPAFPSLIIPCSGEPNPQDITIKASAHKSVTAFIKAAEKENLLTTKALPKHTELVVTGVNTSIPAVQGHTPFVTIGDIEAKAAKKAEREEAQREKEASEHKELVVRELWKPHQVTVDLFQAMSASTSQLYTIPEVRTLVTDYITSNTLINPHDKAYINLDNPLRACVISKTPKASNTKASAGKGKGKEVAHDDIPDSEFMKRDELYRRIIERMQSWYEIQGEGRDPILKKGHLQPIRISIKMRQGRKASTLVTAFEPFFIDAEDMAEELRKVCAGATSVAPVTGTAKGSGLMHEVLVQGKQANAVADYLRGKGVPRKWIEAVDMTK